LGFVEPAAVRVRLVVAACRDAPPPDRGWPEEEEEEEGEDARSLSSAAAATRSCSYSAKSGRSSAKRLSISVAMVLKRSSAMLVSPRGQCSVRADCVSKRRAGAGRIVEHGGEAPSMAEPPEGITLARNRDLRGKLASPMYRRALLCCVAALPVLALLGVFGQKPSTSHVDSQGVDLSVTAPTRLRSGLIFQVQVEVIAHRPVKQLEVVFDRGWWDSMSVNSIVPEPSEESSEDGQVVLSFGQLSAGGRVVFWIYFQANPTNVGKRREDVEVRDGSTPLAHVHRSMTIFP
jgi:hypothetical protein